MRLNPGDVIKSIHTGNAFVVEYVSADGHCFILQPRGKENSHSYNMHDFNRSFVRVSESDTLQAGNPPLWVGVDWAKGCEPGNSPVTPDCWCRACRPVSMNDMRFAVCPDCGNKRCLRANDHKNDCSGSNEPGQEGSAYPAGPQDDDVKPLIPEIEKMPMQPLLIDEYGTLRFKANSIVMKLLDYSTERGYGLNEIGLEQFDAEDRMQLAQLIGFSLDGYGNQTYVTGESHERATAAAPQETD